MTVTDLDPQVLKAQFLEIVQDQIREGSPPETKQTYDRLMAEEHTHEETMNMIACVVANEIFGVLKNNEPVSEERYVAALKSLPELPWDNE